MARRPNDRKRAVHLASRHRQRGGNRAAGRQAGRCVGAAIPKEVPFALHGGPVAIVQPRQVIQVGGAVSPQRLVPGHCRRNQHLAPVDEALLLQAGDNGRMTLRALRVRRRARMRLHVRREDQAHSC